MPIPIYLQELKLCVQFALINLTSSKSGHILSPASSNTACTFTANTGGVHKVRVVSFLLPCVAFGVIPSPVQLQYNHGNQHLCNAGLCELCCRSNGRPLTGQISFLPFSSCLVVCGTSSCPQRLMKLVLVG